MPSTTDYAKYDDLIGHRVEVDRVRKASHKRPARLAVDARVRERSLDDTGKHHVDFGRKGSAKPRALFLVPVTGRRAALPPLAGGEQDVVSRSAEKLPTHLIPGNG